MMTPFALRISFIFLAVATFVGCSDRLRHVPEAKHNEMGFSSGLIMQDYFAYKVGKQPILSAHRGGLEKGFPENSIEAFENVLKYHPAFFEVDPRLTKDSVVVLMHDATLERTTNGKGKLADYTYAEVRKLRLKDKDGNLTGFKVPTLKEAILWSRGKTVLNLDHKDVPLQLTAEILKQIGNPMVMLTVHDVAEAKFYFSKSDSWMLSAHILDKATFERYLAAHLPFKRIMAYIGPKFSPENLELLQRLNQMGVSAMISTASSVDKMPANQRAVAYHKIFATGANVLETDRPVELSYLLKVK